ncbi:MAG: tRNA pseudouridine(13) synthase TruD [Kangiellaceae bacterium]|nr:tRNA pseudouridine(13) synthase TruD [Kangiellaceae bacterium]
MQKTTIPEDINQILPLAHGFKRVSGDLRTNMSDFQVDEVLSFEPGGVGEHLFVKISKDGCNTDWVAKQLQKDSGLTPRDIGYAGKKDRHSVSTQWFSLHLPGREIDLSKLENDSFRIVESIRHNKKLRLGSIKENRFEITLRNLSSSIDLSNIETLLQKGFPNYFGPQRFGFQNQNLNKADDMLTTGKKVKNRNMKGLLISSARSFIFNLQLAQRIEKRNWNTVIDGDCLMLNNSQSFYHLESNSTSEQQRLEQGDTHVSGWLAGKQVSQASDESLDIEQQVTTKFADWISGLNRLNVDSSRRAYRVIPHYLLIKQSDGEVVFRFALPKGCYATSLLRELIDYNDVSKTQY